MKRLFCVLVLIACPGCGGCGDPFGVEDPASDAPVTLAAVREAASTAAKKEVDGVRSDIKDIKEAVNTLATNVGTLSGKIETEKGTRLEEMQALEKRLGETFRAEIASAKPTGHAVGITATDGTRAAASAPDKQATAVTRIHPDGTRTVIASTGDNVEIVADAVLDAKRSVDEFRREVDARLDRIEVNQHEQRMDLLGYEVNAQSRARADRARDYNKRSEDLDFQAEMRARLQPAGPIQVHGHVEVEHRHEPLRVEHQHKHQAPVPGARYLPQRAVVGAPCW